IMMIPVIVQAIQHLFQIWRHDHFAVNGVSQVLQRIFEENKQCVVSPYFLTKNHQLQHNIIVIVVSNEWQQ
ncbi:hypothetical protein OFB93_29990, partial [Escherichia coli]|nr:hypothetical protein [Escherichia coli]